MLRPNAADQERSPGFPNDLEVAVVIALRGERLGPELGRQPVSRD